MPVLIAYNMPSLATGVDALESEAACRRFFALSEALGLPALLDGEYRHSMPQVRHLEQIGLAFEHFTLARKQPSQDARRRG